MAVIAAEDGTSLLNEAEIAARWETIFFQEFSGRGERVQPKDVESRLRELRIPWQAQLRHDACDALGRMRNGKAIGEYFRKGCRADGAQVAWFHCPKRPCHSCLGTGMRFGTQNSFCHYRASSVHLVSLTVS